LWSEPTLWCKFYNANCDSSVGNHISFQPPPFLGRLQVQSSLDQHIFKLVTYETIPILSKAR
jgi:hypothetical protein